MKLRRFAFLMIAILVGVCLVSCGGGTGSTTEEKYEITYVLNEGELPTDAIFEFDNSKGAVLPVPTRTGYKFDGWYTSADFSSNKIARIPANQGKDVTVYAKWTALSGETYEIIYELEGGVLPEGAPASFNSAVGLDTLPTPTKERYEFVGWFDAQDKQVTSIPAGTANDVTLTAKWELESQKIYYKITYICEGGTLPADAPTQFQGGVGCILPEPTPNNEGEDFLGWYNVQTQSQIDRISDQTFVDVTVEAKFGVKKPYEPKWTLNTIGFTGQGMIYEIKVLPVNEFDPFASDYTGSSKNAKQAHQTEVEDAYDITIKYTAWGDDALWGPVRVNYINQKYLADEFGDVYVVNIASQWIPTLDKGGSIAELFDLSSGKGIFAGLNNEYDDNSGYEQDETINEATSVQQRVYGYSLGTSRPDYFMYYNADKVKSLGLEDPAELWMKGEWTITKFEQWVALGQNALKAEGGFVLDMGFAESIIGMTAAVGNSMTKVNPPVIYLTQPRVTETIERLQRYYQAGYYSGRGTDDVAPGFAAGTTLLHHGDLWFLKSTDRFDPTKMLFTIGVVPYPAADGEGGIPVTTTDVNEAISIGSDQYLTDANGNYIKTVDMEDSTFQIPFTGTSCYAILNFENGNNGINPEIAMHILHDLLGAQGADPNAAATLSDEEAYRNFLETKFDREIDVEVVMSCQGKTYFELMELLSMTVGGGSHFGTDAWWPLAKNLVNSANAPATKLNEVLGKYKQAMRDLGYNVQ